jgi:hypothetical protein
VLKLMLERLGCDFSHPRGVHATAGPALQVLNQAAGDPALRTLRPSALAAAVLLASRKSAGGWQHKFLCLLACDADMQQCSNQRDTAIGIHSADWTDLIVSCSAH